MADIVNAQGTNIPPTMRTRWVELADGTHALVLAAVLMGQSDSGAGAELVTLDAITGAIAMITTPHHEVHEGETYQSSFKSADGAPVADNANCDLLIQVGSLTMHAVFEIAGGGDSELAFYEGTTFSNAGGALTENNMDRTSSNTATATVTSGPTVTNAGTLLENKLIPGGTGGNAAGGTIRTDTEWILAANTNYLQRGINRASTAQPMSCMIQWYEE